MNASAIVPNVPVEVANLPPSPITKLACYLLAIGLAQLAKADATTISQSFVKQTREIQNFVQLGKYGIKSTYISENPKITAGFTDSIKKAIASKISNDNSVTSEELKFAKFAVLFAANPEKNANYLDRARKFATTVSAAFLRNFDKVTDRVKEAGGTVSSSRRNIRDIYEELDAVMSSILGRKLKKGETSLPTDLLKEVRFQSTTKADLVKQYKALKRQLSLSYDIDFTSYMAGQSDLVPVNEAYEYMTKLGYRDSKVLMTEKAIPLKVGMQNGKIKYFTKDGKPLAANVPANAIAVKFARTYNDKTGTGAYLTYTTPDASGITRVYTETHTQQATESKFSAAAKVDASIDKVVGRWKKDLTNTNLMTQMAATACMMVYLTGMRVGSRQNTAASVTGEKTFGAISLRPKHVSITGTSIILKYKGKKGVDQKHIIKIDDTATKRMAANLKNYVANKRGDTLVFSYMEKNKEKILTYNMLTKYLAASGYPAGLHKMRHVRGTNLVIEMLNKTKWQPTAKAINNLTKRQKEAETYIIDKVITPVTQLLGHKAGSGKLLWRTTIKSYINPTPLLKWFADHDLRKPSWLPASASKDG